MAHGPTLERWGALLRPLFPHHAELQVKPAAGELRFTWPPGGAVAIFIAANAVADYRTAQDDVRSAADQNLIEFVRTNLERSTGASGGEFRIVVASIDFVPLR